MAIRMDATADQLTRTTTLPTITNFTMMAWAYRVGTAATYGTVLAYGASGASTTNYYAVGVGSNGTSFNLYNGTTDATGGTVPQNAWSHLAVTVAGTGAGQCLGYLNGVLAATLSGTGANTATILRVGNDNFSEFWNGRIAAVKLYAAVLTAAEILMEMRCYVPYRTANLNTWSPLFHATDLANFAGTGVWTSAGTLTTEDGPPIVWGLTPVRQWGRVFGVPPPAETVFWRAPTIVGQALWRGATF